MRTIIFGLFLLGCTREFSTGPMIIISSPRHQGTVGNAIDECREIEISGKIYNVDRPRDYSFFVQGHKIPAISFQATSALGLGVVDNH